MVKLLWFILDWAWDYWLSLAVCIVLVASVVLAVLHDGDKRVFRQQGHAHCDSATEYVQCMERWYNAKGRDYYRN